MNLRWLKQNIGVSIFLAAFLIALGVILFFAKQAAGVAAQVEQNLEQQKSQLEQLKGLKPYYPSKENIDVLRHDREELQQQYSNLLQRVSTTSIVAPELKRDVEFSQQLRETLKDLSTRAADVNVKTPEAFAFGFSRYVATFPCRNPVASEAECRALLGLLAKQLAVVHKLGMMILNSGVNEILEIRRTELEPGGTSADALAVPIGKDLSGLYQTLPFEIKVACDTTALQTLLNSLSKSDWFFAVRSVNIIGEASTSAEAGAAAAKPPIAPAKGATEIAGRERLLVSMRVDLVELTGDRKPTS
jgi:hypothetical protein